MSQNQQQPAAQPPADQTQLTPEQHKQASAQLLDRITADVFFSKLSEFQIVPKTAEEAEQLLNIGLNIDKLSQHPSVKQAEARQKTPSFLSFANQRLTEKLAEFGMVPPEADADEEAINKLAMIYTSEPIVQEAVLSVYGSE
jgi:hypothetical protein